MDNNDLNNKKIESKKGIWRQLNMLIWIYGASIVLPAIAAMVAHTKINDDLKDLGYVTTAGTNQENDLKWLEYLLPGRVLDYSYDVIKDAYRLHNDGDYQNKFIQTGLETGKIKTIGVSK